jgi:gas vesicle protein
MNYFFVGAVTGLVAGLLLAPKPGIENREMFKERFSSLRDTLMRKETTDDGGSGEEALESTGPADYLH